MTTPFGKLVFTTPNHETQEFFLTQPKISIGRAATNALRLDEPGIAAHHARIGRSEIGCHIIALDSTAEMRVNNRPVRKALLTSGSVIQLGECLLQFVVPHELGSSDMTSLNATLVASQATISALSDTTVAAPRYGRHQTAANQATLTSPRVTMPSDDTTVHQVPASLIDTQTRPNPTAGTPQTETHQATSQATSAEQIGRYVLQANLGNRGPFTVYQAYDPHLARIVAVKVMTPRYAENTAFRTRVQREVEAIAALEHHAIVQVFDFGTHENRPYVVMPCMVGGTLTARLMQGPLSPEALVPIVQRIAVGLEAAHRQGIIHRELRPANILFDAQDVAYLSDFSPSTIRETMADATENQADVADTLKYISPEQARSLLENRPLPLDGRSDIYSLGLIMFEVLTGKTPFQGDTLQQLAAARLNVFIPSIQQSRPDLPATYQTLFNYALAENPAERYNAAPQLARHLQEIVTGRATSQTDISLTKPYLPIQATQSINHQPENPQSATKTTPESSLGFTIGRYEVERQIGHGGMATVYLARDPVIKRSVAIKVLTPTLMNNPYFYSSFHSEARLIARLDHGSIVSVYDFGEYNNQPYIVMQYLPKGTLADRLTNGPLPLHTISAIMTRVSSALDEAHRHHIIHRDVKPANILFNARGNALLSDFGISLIADAASGVAGGNFFAGTPNYLSPEQAKSVLDQSLPRLDHRSDIYALGIILYEALSGQVPFQADTLRDTAAAHLSAPIPQLGFLRSQLPSLAQHILERALAKHPDRRYQTAGALARDVAKLVEA